MRDRLDTVFLDRDGTINAKAHAHDYVTTWRQFHFLPGAVEGIRLLTEAGLRIVVVTNQRGVALGRMTEADLDEIHQEMRAQLAHSGARIDAMYHCPHADRACDCRKPDIGLFLRARQDFPQIDFRRSAVIGDSWRDVQAAVKLGALSVLVVGSERGAHDGADHVVPSLHAAATLLTRTRSGSGRRRIGR